MPLPLTALAQYIATVFDRCESQPAPKFKTSAQIGAYGERIASVYLQRRHGYRLLVRNYEADPGEIDLICRDRDTLVFVEVRTRTHEEYVTSIETIDRAKQARLENAARQYLAELEDREVPYRFDAVGITWRAGEIPICTLVRNLF